MALDHLIYEWIGTFHHRSVIFDFVMVLLELHLLRYLLVGLLVWIWFTRSTELQRAAIVSFLAVIMSVALRPAFKHIWDRERPYELYGCPGLAPCYPDSSFPSGHLFLIAAMTVPIWRASWKAGIAMAILGFTISISRIYLGEHWPTDLVAGGAMGTGAGYALSYASERKPLAIWIATALRVLGKLKLPGGLPGEALAGTSDP
jgi:undecaprenyl-diphosphatase